MENPWQNLWKYMHRLNISEATGLRGGRMWMMIHYENLRQASRSTHQRHGSNGRSTLALARVGPLCHPVVTTINISKPTETIDICRYNLNHSEIGVIHQLSYPLGALICSHMVKTLVTRPTCSYVEIRRSLDCGT